MYEFNFKQILWKNMELSAEVRNSFINKHLNPLRITEI